MWSDACLLSVLRCVHWLQVCRLSGLVLRPGGVLPAFCPLYCFAFGGLLADMPLFSVLRRFLAWFGVFVWVCIASVLCVACVAFVCVNS